MEKILWGILKLNLKKKTHRNIPIESFTIEYRELNRKISYEVEEEEEKKIDI